MEENMKSLMEALNNGSDENQANELKSVPELTFGQKAVGLKFNPSNDDKVAKCKQKYADCIDQLNDIRNSTENQEVKRLCSVAITETQGSQMWAVKAITWS